MVTVRPASPAARWRRLPDGSGDGSGDGPGLRGGVVAPVDLHAEPGLGGCSRHVQAVAGAARDLGPDRPERVREAVRPGPALVADRVARPLVDRRDAGSPASDVTAQAAGHALDQ